MSFDNQLIHTCTIENAKVGTADAHNNKTTAWDVPIENVRCRLVEKRQRIWSDERAESAVQTVYLLLVNQDAELRDRGRITQVTLEDGSVMAQKFVVTEILKHLSNSLHHKTAALEKIS